MYAGLRLRHGLAAPFIGGSVTRNATAVHG
nr:MAG TPA: hypothetical protein [Caudoviricetes sp.]